MLKRLAVYLQPYRKYLILGPLCVLLEVICELLMPLLMARIVDIGVAEMDLAYISKIGLLMAGLALLAIAFGCANMVFSARTSIGFGADLRQDVFQRITEFSFGDIDKFSSASLVTRLTNDVLQIQNLTMMTLRMLVRAPLMLICAAVVAISISPRLASTLLVTIPLLLLTAIVVMKKAGRLFIAVQQRLDQLNGKVQENLIGIRAVKSFVREDYEKERFQTANDNFMKAGLKASGLVIVIMPIMMLLLNGTTIATLWLGGQMVGLGQLGSGELIGFISYIMQILMSMMMISMIFIMLSRARASAGRIIEVLDTLPAVGEPESPQAAPRQAADAPLLRFEQVSFKYEAEAEEDILHQISFEARPGELVAIVGATGSGKTSLVSLIPRLYDVTTGKISFAGQDVRDYALDDLRQRIAMVLQKNVLFSGTIRENLLWGDAEASPAEIERACQAAQATEFIDSFEDGYETELGQGGVNLSGGQKQRLCIARALLKQPDLLILDDSTSAVDSATEAKLRRAFYEDYPETTVLMITQRVSSLAGVDKILVLHEGELVGCGNHEQLLRENRIYREIYQSQQEEVVA